MPTYHYFPFEGDFPPGFDPKELEQRWTVQVSPQLALESIIDNPVSSTLIYLGKSEHEGFYRFKAIHEVELSQPVRFLNQRLNYVILLKEFEVYLPVDRSGIYLSTRGQIARQFMQRFASQYQMKYFLREIDLQKLRQHVTVRGGWFTDLEIPDVSVAAIFGANVEASEDWERYEEAGTISAIVVEFPYNQTRISINISRSGAITIYGKRSEEENLSIVEHVNEQLKDYITTIEPKRGRT